MLDRNGASNSTRTAVYRCHKNKVSPCQTCMHENIKIDLIFVRSIVEQYLGGRMSVTLQCTEADDEAPIPSQENFLHLSCFIGQDTGHMQSGLKAVSCTTLMRPENVLISDFEVQ